MKLLSSSLINGQQKYNSGGNKKKPSSEWPTKIRLDNSFIRELQAVLSYDDYKRLNDKITLIPDDSNPFDGMYVAKDDEGNVVDLIRSLPEMLMLLDG